MRVKSLTLTWRRLLLDFWPDAVHYLLIFK